MRPRFGPKAQPRPPCGLPQPFYSLDSVGRRLARFVRGMLFGVWGALLLKEEASNIEPDVPAQADLVETDVEDVAETPWHRFGRYPKPFRAWGPSEVPDRGKRMQGHQLLTQAAAGARHTGVGLNRVRKVPGYPYLSSSFLGLPYRVLNINHKKELLRGLWLESGLVIHRKPGSQPQGPPKRTRARSSIIAKYAGRHVPNTQIPQPRKIKLSVWV